MNERRVGTPLRSSVTDGDRDSHNRSGNGADSNAPKDHAHEGNERAVRQLDDVCS